MAVFLFSSSNLIAGLCGGADTAVFTSLAAILARVWGNFVLMCKRANPGVSFF